MLSVPDQHGFPDSPAWPDSTPASPVPAKFPVDALPEYLGKWAMGVAQRMRIPVSIPAAIGLAAVSAAVGPYLVRMNGNITSPGALWVMFDADSPTGRRVFSEILEPLLSDAESSLQRMWIGEHALRKREVFDAVRGVITTESRAHDSRSPKARADFLAARERLFSAKSRVTHVPVLAECDPSRDRVYDLLHNQDRLIALFSGDSSIPVTVTGDGRSFIAPSDSRNGVRVNTPFLTAVVCFPKRLREIFSKPDSRDRDICNRSLIIPEEVPAFSESSNVSDIGNAYRQLTSMFTGVLLSTFDSRGHGVQPPLVEVTAEAVEELRKVDSPLDARIVLQLASTTTLLRQLAEQCRAASLTESMASGGNTVRTSRQISRDDFAAFSLDADDVIRARSLVSWTHSYTPTAVSVVGQTASDDIGLLMAKVIRYMAPRIRKGAEVFTPRDINRGVRGVSAANMASVLTGLSARGWVRLDKHGEPLDAGKWRVHPRLDIPELVAVL